MEGRAAAALIQSGRVVKDTRRQYNARLKKMKEHFQHVFPEALDEDGEIRVPMQTDHCLDFFGIIHQTNNNRNAAQEEEHFGDDRDEEQAVKAVSTLGGYRSAVVFLYKERNIKMQEDLNVGLSNFMQGYKRKVGELKQNGLMSITEGRQPLAFSGYRLLALKFLQLQKNTQALFAWPYFLLCWNLMARSDSINKIMHQHMSWREDALIITFAIHKGDREGQNAYGRHVYANPDDPSICPILALATMVLCRGHRVQGGLQQLFEGNHSEKRFSMILNSVVGSLTDAEAGLLGARRQDIGMHSTRKGAPTHCLGITEGPSPIQIFLRAGWSLGNVQDRYLFAGRSRKIKINFNIYSTVS